MWVFAPEAPEPPTPAMRIVAARTLPDLIRLAPGYFWEGGAGGRLPDRAGEGRRQAPAGGRAT